MSRWEKSTLEILFSLKTFLIRRKFEASVVNVVVVVVDIIVSVDDDDIFVNLDDDDDDNVKKNRFTQLRLQNGYKSCLAPEG